MKIEQTSLPGVLVLTPKIYRDDRGAFSETFNLRRMAEAGLPTTWVQDNFSVSQKNVLRGIHYQVAEPQGKLVRVTHGAVLDVAVDLRRSSTSFGKHVAVELNGENGRVLWIPAGFGHAFLVLSEMGRVCLQSDGLLFPGGRADDFVERSGAGDQVADCRRGCDSVGEGREGKAAARRRSVCVTRGEIGSKAKIKFEFRRHCVD